MSLLIPALLSFAAGFFGRGGYDAATADTLCTDVYAQLVSEQAASGLQYMGPRTPAPGVELHGWLDEETGEIHVRAFVVGQEMALVAQKQGFTGEGLCVTPAGSEVYMFSSKIPAPALGDEANSGQ